MIKVGTMFSYKPIFVMVVASIMGSVLVSESQMDIAIASSKSPYESGYDHGCDDAGISDADDRYINQPEKGPSFHTQEFMSGYHDGFRSCGGGSVGGNGDFGRDDNGGTSEGFQSEDSIQEFCAALSRGDYVAAEGLLASTGYGSLALGARLGCGLIELANSLEN